MRPRFDSASEVVLEIVRHYWEKGRPASVWGEEGLRGARALAARGYVEIRETTLRIADRTEYHVRLTRAGELLFVDESAPFLPLRVERRCFGDHQGVTGLLAEARAASSRGRP